MKNLSSNNSLAALIFTRFNRHKKLILFALILLSAFGSARLYYRLTDDIRLSNMTYHFPIEQAKQESSWRLPPLTDIEQENLAKIVNQKFHYLGKGAQSYVFGSEDKQYVIKFFKFKHLKPNPWIEYLPLISPFLEYKTKAIERKKRKLNDPFNGYALAYHEGRESSGLVYVHLVIPTTDLKLNATVYDKLGRELTIPLDEYVFVIQKRGVTLGERLHALLREGRLTDAQSTLSHIFDMYVSDYQKGIYDRDDGVIHNTGFIDTQPFHLDVGRMTKEEQMKEVEFYKKDFEVIVGKIDFWVKKTFPEYYPKISPFLSSEFEKRTGEKIDFHALDSKRYQKRKTFFGI